MFKYWIKLPYLRMTKLGKEEKLNFKNILITALIGGLISGSIVAWFNTNPPIVYFNFEHYPWTACYSSGIPIGKNFSYDIELQNRGQEIAYSEFCFYAENITFSYKGIEKKGSMCFSRTELNPFYSSDLLIRIEPTIFIDSENSPEEIQLKMTASCDYKIFSILPKLCKSKVEVCNYKKQANNYVLLKE